jgi:ribosome-associated toxin RatA of RatAB toxin-antitoxin module
MNNYQDFLSWCKTNNFSLLQFKKTIANQRAYCSFIEKNYKTRSMLASVKETDYFLHSIERKNKKENYKYILSNLRMSICEMG